MAIYPNDYDSLPKPGPNTHEDDEGFYHDELEKLQSEAIEALQNKVGKDGETDPSHEQRITEIEGSIGGVTDVGQPAESDAPTTYPLKLSLGDATTANGWPINGTLFTVKESNAHIAQTLLEYKTGTTSIAAFYQRRGATDSDDWGPWQRTQDRSERGANDGYASLDSGGHVPRGELGSGTANSDTLLKGDGTWERVRVGEEVESSFATAIKYGGF